MNDSIIDELLSSPTIDDLLEFCKRAEFVRGHGRTYMFVAGKNFQGLTAEDCIREYLRERTGDRND